MLPFLLALLLCITGVYGETYSIQAGMANRICRTDDRVFEQTASSSVSQIGCVFSCMSEGGCNSVFWGATTGCTGCSMAYSDDQSTLLHLPGTTYAQLDIDCGKPDHDISTELPSSYATSYASMVTFECAVGYHTLAGDKTLRCGLDWHWSSISPTCSPVECGVPDSGVSTVLVEPFTTMFPSLVTYECAVGYHTLVGDEARTCTPEGIWSGTKASCTIKDCDNPLPNRYTNYVDDNFSTTYRSVVNFTCYTGYKYSHGSESRICQANGTWSDTSLTCTIVDCGDPILNPNTEYDGGFNTTYLASANFRCSEGYKYDSGSESRICLADGSWSGVALGCIKIVCAEPYLHPNTEYVSAVNTYYLSTVNFKCSDGYLKSNGSTSRICQANSSWSGTALICILVDCGTPTINPNTDHGGFLTTTYGSTVNLTCSLGYVQSGGSDQLTCESDGSWSGSAITCEIVDCGNPTLNSNTKQEISISTTYLSTVNFECSIGYEHFSGSFSRSCQANGLWSEDALTCRVKDCGYPFLQPNTEYYGSVSTIYLSSINFQCSTGYVQSGGSTTRTCQADYTWSGVALTCTLVDCGTPRLAENTEHKDIVSTKYLSKVSSRCTLGHKVVSGSTTRSCQTNGTWSGDALTCTQVDCGPLVLKANTDFVDISSLTTDYQSSVAFTCVTGYTPFSGSETRTCQEDGYWSGTQLRCTLIDCGTPVLNSNTAFFALFFLTTYGSTIRVECVTGYLEDQGSITRNCQANGLWSGTKLTCVIADCGTPSLIDYTYFADPNIVTTYGSTVDILCNTGYEPSGGESSLTCQASQSWSGSPLTCSIIDCEIPFLTQNTVYVGNTKYSSTIKITCSIGYMSNSEPVYSVCQADRSWSITTLSCVIVDCGTLQLNPNVHFVDSAYATTYGSTVELVCGNGYEKSGGFSSVTCEDSTYWSGNLQCSPVDCGSPITDPNSAVYVSQTGFTKYPTSIEAACLGGFWEVNGDKYRTCQANGFWTGYPLQCKKLNILVLCEGNAGVISCPTSGTLISVVVSYWGRKDWDTCKTGIVWSGDCIIDYTSKFSVLTTGLQEFSIPGSDVSTFALGDPCYASPKYLVVAYVCADA